MGGGVPKQYRMLGGKPVLRWVQVRASNAALARLAKMAAEPKRPAATAHQ